MTDRALYGGAGDKVYADHAGDAVLGDAGDAFIETDRMGCGPGTDSVSADRKDLVSPHREVP